MFGLLWIVLGAITTTLVLILFELALSIFFSFGGASSSDQQQGPQQPVPSCAPGQLIIQIHGTDSTGQFKPDIARGLDPADLPAGILEAEQNEEFYKLLAGTEDCWLTFSYDDEYFPENGTRKRGRHAWNRSTSPWNVQPNVLADRLQALIGDQPADARIDILAYSAGGIVPTYWAARNASSTADRIDSITVIDGIVWGAELPFFDLACWLPGLRQTEIHTYGRVPCQFRAASEFTSAVRGTTGRWSHPVPLATLRARGDLIVWHRFAGLSGGTIADPPLIARPCERDQWVMQFLQCVLATHGWILEREAAVDALRGVLSRE